MITIRPQLMQEFSLTASVFTHNLQPDGCSRLIEEIVVGLPIVGCDMGWDLATTLSIRWGTKCLAAFYQLCAWILPKRKQILFLSRQANLEPFDFALLREEIEKRGNGYRAVSLCKQLSNCVTYLPHLLKQIIYLATSSAVVLDSYSLAVSLLADDLKIPVLQIWHGVGNMKKFGYTALDTSEGNSRRIAELMRMHAGYDSVLVSSLSFAPDFAKGLGVPESLMFECPLPRCDVLRDRVGQARDREFLHQLSGGRPVVVYAPTFRRSKPGSTSSAQTDTVAMCSLFTALLERGFAIAYRPHPITSPVNPSAKNPNPKSPHIDVESGVNATTATTIISSENTPTIELNELIADNPYVLTDFSNCPPGFNLVRAADALVSDYSTIIYEAGLASIPVYLYGYDWKQYQQQRGLYIDPSRDVPTVFSSNPQVIADAIANNTCDLEEFFAFIHRNVSMPQVGTCTCKAVDHLFELIDRGKTRPKYWK